MNDNLAIVSFNNETHQLGNPRYLEEGEKQNEVLNEECILESQISTQSISQPLDSMTFFSNTMEKVREDNSPMTIFKHPRISEASLTNERHSTAIFKIICSIEKNVKN